LGTSLGEEPDVIGPPHQHGATLGYDVVIFMVWSRAWRTRRTGLSTAIARICVRKKFCDREICVLAFRSPIMPGF
jgi:hypothetical protein